ncbi:MAG: cupredoxin domain-containing protein [Mycolicibacterium sp.]|nr:cupredoxin domain-containing protein [Mycolicibacterium sp.]
MILIFAFLFTGMVTACGGGTDSAVSTESNLPVPQTTATAAPVPDITISNFTFAVRGPVKAGQQVTVLNEDDPSHSIAADAPDLFDIRVSGGGGTSTFTAPSAPGTYAFHCKYHAMMNGTLVVQ